VITYDWRGPFTSTEVSALHAAAFAHREAARNWRDQVERHSLGWVCARNGDDLAGFVNVAWDGGAHAFILDTMVAPRMHRQGTGTRLVTLAIAEARRAGCTSTSRSTCGCSTSAAADSPPPPPASSRCELPGHLTPPPKPDH
jgi:GNAT superfamily N-acetyltransferase